MAEFPANWPPGCPPADAKDANGAVHRIVKNNPPTEEDFLSYAETGQLPYAENRCMLVGLSVLHSIGDARRKIRRYPRLGTLVAKGELNSAHGKLTGQRRYGHLTWWPFENVDRAAPFEVVENVNFATG